MHIALRKHPVILVIAVLLTGLLVWGFWPQPIAVEIVAAHKAPMTVSIEEEGRTRVIDRYIISAPVDGVACRVHLDVGDAVEQGQALLYISPLQSQVLDPRSRARAEAQVAAAESALLAAEAQVRAAVADERLARTESGRLQALLEKGAVARDAYDQAATTLQTRSAARRSAEFNVDVARYELKAARTVLEHSSATGGEGNERVPVTAPVKGRILKIDHECEGPVRTGEALLEVGNPEALEVEVDVLSADAVRIRAGMPVEFGRWGGHETLQGVVRIIEPVGFTKVSALGVEEQRVLIISDITSPTEQWRRLGDGYRVEARFILWQEDEVLQVPASSLFRYGDGWAVFVMEEGRALRRTVEVGQRNGLRAQILSGLEPGEAVIDHPDDDIEDRRRVTAIR